MELVKEILVLEVGSFVIYEGDDIMDYEGGNYIFLELRDSSFFFLCTFFQGFELHTRKGWAKSLLQTRRIASVSVDGLGSGVLESPGGMFVTNAPAQTNWVRISMDGTWNLRFLASSPGNFKSEGCVYVCEGGDGMPRCYAKEGRLQAWWDTLSALENLTYR